MSSETMIVEQSDERDALRARLPACGPPSPEAGREHADYADARGARSRPSGCSRWRSAAARRPRARARVRPGRAGPRGGRAGRARRRGRPVRRRRRDDRHRRRARRALGLRNVSRPRARPRADRRARRRLRRRALPRGPHVRARSRRARRARSAGCCARAAASRSPSGGRASAIRGWRSCWTPSARRSGRRCRRPASPARSRSATPTAAAACSTAPASPTCGVERARRAAAGRVVRRVVGADVGARRPAVARSSRRCPRRPRRRCASAPARRRALRDRVGRAGLPGRDAGRRAPARLGGGGASSARRAARPPRPRGRWPGGRRCASPAAGRSRWKRPDSPCSSSTTSAWKRRPFLSTCDDVAGAMPLELRRGDAGGGRGGEQGGLAHGRSKLATEPDGDGLVHATVQRDVLGAVGADVQQRPGRPRGWRRAPRRGS